MDACWADNCDIKSIKREGESEGWLLRKHHFPSQRNQPPGRAAHVTHALCRHNMADQPGDHPLDVMKAKEALAKLTPASSCRPSNLEPTSLSICQPTSVAHVTHRITMCLPSRPPRPRTSLPLLIAAR